MTDDEIDTRAREIGRERSAVLYERLRIPGSADAARAGRLDGNGITAGFISAALAGLLAGKAERDKLASSLAEKDAHSARLGAEIIRQIERVQSQVSEIIRWQDRAEEAESRAAELEGALTAALATVKAVPDEPTPQPPGVAELKASIHETLGVTKQAVDDCKTLADLERLARPRGYTFAFVAAEVADDGGARMTFKLTKMRQGIGGMANG